MRKNFSAIDALDLDRESEIHDMKSMIYKFIVKVREALAKIDGIQLERLDIEFKAKTMV